jgi:hypothetical protein
MLCGVLTCVISGIVLLITVSTSGYVVNYFRLKKQEIKDNADDILNLKQSILIIRKALLIITKAIDRQTEKAHGEDPELADLTRELLRQEENDKE